jgi:hypothetical protein
MRANIILLLFVALIFSACTRHGLITRTSLAPIRPLHDFSAKDTSETPQYNDTALWIVHSNTNKKVDVFFVHPTTYLSHNQWNMPLNDKTSIKLAKEFSAKAQASVFEEIANIYMPQYRQATFYSFVTKSDNGEKALALATCDIRNAWKYFLTNINKGNPIIIAGHSQGSMIIMRLLPEIMSDSILAKKIIAVYAIGWPLSKEYLKENPKIKVCQDSLQNGCIISWNTESKHNSSTIIDRPSVSINPLLWTTDETIAKKDLHKGAVFFHFFSKPDTIPYYVSAQNVDGHLKVSKIPNYAEVNKYPTLGAYHIFDYNMFYINIKQNARDRTKHYFKTNRN